MMKYQEPEMDITELELVDTTGMSDDTTIWDDENDIGGGTGESGTIPGL